MGRARRERRRRRGAVPAELSEDAGRAQARAAVTREEAEELAQKLVDRQVARLAWRPHLAPGALIGILVGTEAHELRAVPEAALFELVEAHLDDELRLERLFLKFAGSPAVRFREVAVALRVEQREHER